MPKNRKDFSPELEQDRYGAGLVCINQICHRKRLHPLGKYV